MKRESMICPRCVFSLTRCLLSCVLRCQTARKAGEAAMKAGKDHRLRERAGNALRLVRSKVKR